MVVGNASPSSVLHRGPDNVVNALPCSPDLDCAELPALVHPAEVVNCTTLD